MQHVQPVSRPMQHVRHTASMHTRVVSVTPRQVALYHLKRFATTSIVLATIIISVLYTVALIIGTPTVIS